MYYCAQLMCTLSAFSLKCPADTRTHFGKLELSNEAWALLQNLLSMNYGNLVTAAFNYNTEAGSGEKWRETDREGMTVGGL